MASKLSGVGVHTIRAWEKRYKALVPNRDSSGHRTYSKVDVEKLILLSELCLLGYTISKVANLSISELKEQLKDLGKSEESLQTKDFNLVSEAKAPIDPAQSMPIIIFALKNYNLDIVNLELGKLKGQVSNKEFALVILLPLVRLLNDAFASGTFNQTQCEAIRAILSFHMGHGLYQTHDSNQEKREKSHHNILIAGLQESNIDLTAGLMGLLCQNYSLQFTYLGTDISMDALLDLSKSLDVTSVMLSIGKGQFISSIDKLVGKLDSRIELVLLNKIENKTEIDQNKVSHKKLTILKSVEAFDAFIMQKNF